MKTVLFSFGIILYLASCTNTSSHGGSETDAATRDTEKAQNAAQVPHTAPSFYKRFEGTIANQPVVVYLEKDDSSFSGYYYYTRIGKNIMINGTASKNKDSLVLTEYDQSAVYSGDRQPVLSCIFNGDNLMGKWVSSDGKKSFDIMLKEAYGAGSYTFEMRKYTNSAKAYPEKENSPQATSTYKLPEATGSTAEAGWINEQVRNYLGTNNADKSSLTAIIKEQDDSFFASYRRDMITDEDILKENNGEYPGSWNYDETVVYSIRYNEKGFVVIETMGYSYTGGAHGNYGSGFLNLDVENRRKLNFKDIATIDSTSLQKIMEQYFRKDYNIPVPKPLTDMLFENYLAPTDNFYLGEKGLGFLYNPYEVAAYAVGQIEVFVPYTALMPYLRPDFRKRMKL
ncbi:MAG TPA: DUF3298 domain-containing protein [Flavipsychrobacter sp.]|nr:DUF3298 domain-containing protein [Flavipsychrobacter sp.]